MCVGGGAERRERAERKIERAERRGGWVNVV